MAACEKCWAEAAGNPHEYQAILLKKFAAGVICTAEEQAGPDGSECPDCKRATVHQFAKVCMVCGWRNT